MVLEVGHGNNGGEFSTFLVIVMSTIAIRVS